MACEARGCQEQTTQKVAYHLCIMSILADTNFSYDYFIYSREAEKQKLGATENMTDSHVPEVRDQDSDSEDREMYE